MKEGLKTRIYNFLHKIYLQDKDRFTHAGRLEELAQGAGYLGSTCTRILRSMANREGIIESKGQGKSLVYRYVPECDLVDTESYFTENLI